MDTSRRRSNFWNGMIDLWEDFRENLRLTMGNGEDPWLPNCEALINYTNSIDEEESNLNIRHYLAYNRKWRGNFLENTLPVDTQNKILDYPRSILDDDDFKWGRTPDGSFTSQTSYGVQLGIPTNFPMIKFNFVWDWKGSEWIRTFLWKLGHEAVLTNVKRHRIMMSLPKCVQFAILVMKPCYTGLGTVALAS